MVRAWLSNEIDSCCSVERTESSSSTLILGSILPGSVELSFGADSRTVSFDVSELEASIFGDVDVKLLIGSITFSIIIEVIGFVSGAAGSVGDDETLAIVSLAAEGAEAMLLKAACA